MYWGGYYGWPHKSWLAIIHTNANTGAPSADEIRATLEKHFETTYVVHSSHQNAFVSHFNLQPESRTAYVVTYNTYATAKAGIPPESGIGADWLDREIRTYLFKNVFPLLGGEN
jgi:hypothetical protein